MNKNLISLKHLKTIAINKNIDKYILEYGYSKVKDKKYYIINISHKKINFGNINYSDYTINKDNQRLENFRSRFNKLYQKNKNNIDSPLFYSWNLLW